MKIRRAAAAVFIATAVLGSSASAVGAAETSRTEKISGTDLGSGRIVALSGTDLGSGR